MPDNGEIQAQPGLSPQGVEPATVFSAIADIVYQGSTAEEIYAAICVAATLMVPGCDHASVMLRGNDIATTVAATDAVARTVDKLEQSLNEGPCLDAIAAETPQIDPDLTVGSQWPTLASRVITETPVRGIMGFRLLVSHRKVGALNLMADQPDGFDATSVERAVLLAAFAGVAANAVANGEDAATLHRGLLSNREIGKAIGMLMTLNNIAEEQAFDLLRRISQETHVKLADIAVQIVQRHNRPSTQP
ncbi:GAF and ANTAR domain-containing protein [Mycobacterium sp. MUNTM1]